MKKGLQKMVSITIALSMLVVGLTACGSEKTVSDPPTLSQNEEDDSATGKNTYKIGVVAGESSSPWYIRSAEGAEMFSKDTGYEVFQKAPTSVDAAEQVQVVEDVIAQGIDALCIIPIAPEALEPVLKKARENGIIVIAHEGSTLTNIDYDVEMLIPSLSAFAMAAIKLLPNINRIVAATNQISFLEPALDSIIKTLKEFQNESVEESVKEISVQRDIELHNITFHYPDSNKLILNHANMKIQVGHSVGIIGPSGAGKTTAVDIILGLLKPQEGQILVDGENVLENKEAWLKHVGYIPQTIFMLDATIRENIIFGNDVENDEVRLWNALEDAQLADFVRSLPDGLETAIGERGVRLSGGQRQRIGRA